jgi:hypothetical protein
MTKGFARSSSNCEVKIRNAECLSKAEMDNLSGPREVKSFRLYSPKPRSPQCYASEISPEQSARLRERFQNARARYNRKMLLGLIAMGIAAICSMIGMNLTLSISFAYSSFVVCGITALILVFLLHPNCPACHNAVEDSLGAFCPECGARALQRGGWFKFPKCSSCSREMRHGKSRGYTIRNCTHCGLKLDEKGF